MFMKIYKPFSPCKLESRPMFNCLDSRHVKNKSGAVMDALLVFTCTVLREMVLWLNHLHMLVPYVLKFFEDSLRGNGERTH